MATVTRSTKRLSSEPMPNDPTTPKTPMSREVIILTTFLTCGTLIQGLLSRGFGLTLACMVNSTATTRQTAHNHPSNVSVINKCGQIVQDQPGGASLGYHGTYNWDSIQQANVVAIYSWGSMIVLPFSGFLISLVDARQTVSLALAIIGLSMGLFPVVTQAGGYGGALAIRLVMGFSYAVISPSMDQIVATYTPWEFRNILYATITAGSYVSAVIGNSIGGLLCESDIFGGWPAIYYIAAILAASWLCCWEFYLLVIPRCIEWRATQIPLDKADNKPQKQRARHNLRSVKAISAYIRRFWRDIGKRLALWAMLPSVFASTCTTSLLINYIPTFYRDVLHVSLKSNGLYSALPFLAIIIGSFVFSSVADSLKKPKNSKWAGRIFRRETLSPDWVSKIMNTTGFLGSGIFILLVTFIPCLPTGAAIALLTLAAGAYTGIFPGYRVGIVTIAPKWAAVVSAVSTMTSVVAGIVFPYIQGSIVTTGQESEWHTLFIVIIAIDVVAAVCFLAFGSVTPHEGVPYRTLTSDDDDLLFDAQMSLPTSVPSIPPLIADAADDEKTPLLDTR